VSKYTCPHCDNDISKKELWNAQTFFLGSLAGILRPFACPHCNKMVTWPKWSVRCMTLGCYLWIIGLILPQLEIPYYYIIRPVFWLSIVMIVYPLFTLKLKKADSEE
jgi:peptidoglycan/LPS O-acetylase OafA/YrhL